MRKTAKVMIIVLCVVVSLLIVGLLIAGNYMFKFALDSLSEKDLLQDATEENGAVELSPVEKWFFGQAQNEVITSFDGLKLQAYYLPSEYSSDSFVVLVHGYKSSAGTMASFAHHYHQQGFNVLVPNLRAHGLSEGRYIGMGYLDHYDILDWIDVLLKKNPTAQILLHGISMGAATVMILSGQENIPSNIKAIVEDCGYTSINNQFALQLKTLFGLPPVPLLQVGSLVSKVRAGFYFGDGDCVAAVARSKIPTLFIHGQEDTFVPFLMLDVLYESAACPKQKLVMPNAEHAEALDSNPELYWATVDTFAKKYFPVE
ncbi:MAG: alpha/beta hydrolase [Spirochaetaceae bacterium]|nr:alpha/beta hydrolase [Spirochaetaceae bacterium]